MKEEDVMIREMFPEEYPYMENLMYEAIFHPDPLNPYPKEVIYLPQVKVYWDSWGKREGDHCLIAFVEDKVAGGIWIRTFPGPIKGCGYIDDQTPEIAIALFEGYRGKGIGTQLMKRMIYDLKRKDVEKISLSITKGNQAIRLYQRLNFEIVGENDEDYIMLLKLK